jgi:hypothetical protein
MLVEHDGRNAVGDKLGACDMSLGRVQERANADLIDPLGFTDALWSLASRQPLATAGAGIGLIEVFASAPMVCEVRAGVVGAVFHPTSSRGPTDRSAAAAARASPYHLPAAGGVRATTRPNEACASQR